MNILVRVLHVYVGTYIILTDISVYRDTYCNADELYHSKSAKKVNKIKSVLTFYL